MFCKCNIWEYFLFRFVTFLPFPCLFSLLSSSIPLFLSFFSRHMRKTKNCVGLHIKKRLLKVTLVFDNCKKKFTLKLNAFCLFCLISYFVFSFILFLFLQAIFSFESSSFKSILFSFYPWTSFPFFFFFLFFCR